MKNNDYILRSDAISALCKKCEMTGACDYTGDLCGDVKRIEAIPAADVELVRYGRWVPGKEIARTLLGDETLAVEYSDFHCSLCGQKYKEYVLIYRYCPNCGAKMDREEKNGI